MADGHAVALALCPPPEHIRPLGMSPRFSHLHGLAPVLLLAVVAAAAFQFFGNGNLFYINNPSAIYWWTHQWVTEGTETEHGLLLFPLAVVLFWRNARQHREPDGFRPPWVVIGLVVAGLAALAISGWAFEEMPLAGINLANALLLLSLLATAERVRAREVEVGDVAVGRPVMGLALLAVALLLNLIGFAAQQTRVSLLGILLAFIALATIAGGRRWGRAACAPAFLMLFALPFGTLTDVVGLPLRVGVTYAAELFANTVGIEVIRNGSHLVSADGRFQYDVAPACSGIRSLMALSALCFIVGYFSFRTLWRRGLLLGLSLPFAFAGNVARICSIILAGHWFGQDAGSKVHDNSGFVIFIAVVGLALVSVTLIQKFLPEKPAPAPTPDLARPTALRRQWILVGSACLAIALLGVLSWQIRDRMELDPPGVLLASNGVDPIPMPRSLNFSWMGQDVEVSRVEREVLPPDTGFSRRSYADLQGNRVFVSIVLSGKDRSSIHQAEICLAGQGWSIDSRRIHEFSVAALESGVLPSQLLSISTTQRLPDGRSTEAKALFAYWFVGGDRIVATNHERILRDFFDRMLRGRGHRWAYVFVQTDARDGEEAALARLEEVINLALPKFQTVGMAATAVTPGP